MNPISRGSGETERVGNRTFLTSITLNSIITPTTTGGGTAANPCFVRMVLFVERNPKTVGSAPTNTDIIAVTGTNGIQDILAPHAVPKKSNFKVIFDKTIVCSSTGGGRYNYCFRKYIKLRMPVEWSSSSSADITQNSLWLWVGGSEIVTSAQPQLSFYRRIRFQDL